MKKSVYSLRVLEMVARVIGEYFTGYKIVQILSSFEFAQKYVNYPNTKWWVILEVFKNIKEHQLEPDSKISEIITEFIHPLNHNLDFNKVEELSGKIGKIISYDQFYIVGPDDGLFVVNGPEMEEMHSFSPHDEQVIKKMEDLDKGILFFELKDGLLKINKETGYLSLNNIEINLNPQSKEFQLIVKLATSKNHTSSYKDLIGNNPTKIAKRNLTFIVRNLKKSLGILPEKKQQNKDIIENIKGLGYRLKT